MAPSKSRGGFKRKRKTFSSVVRRSLRRRAPDKIKTAGDVRRAVQSTAPSRAKMDSISQSITSTVSNMLSISAISFNEDSSVFDARQSLKISLGSFRFKGTVVVGDATNLVRLLIVRSKNQTNAAFDPTSAFYSNPGGAVPQAVAAQINTRNVEVLWDKTYFMQDSTAAAPAVRPAAFFIDANVRIGKTIKYNQVGNAITVQPRNMSEYYMIGVSDSGVLPNPSVRLECLTWFKNVD